MRLPTIAIMAGILVALGVVFFISSRPKPEARPEPRPFVWSVDMQELAVLAISLPREGKSEKWVKHEDHYWYFDKPDGPKVDMQRWGGGIPLILSGPGAQRIISSDPTAEQLETYGLADPTMKIDLTLENGTTISIELGNATPDGQAYYIKLVDSRQVYTVHFSWYDVLERLVLEPPYPAPEAK